MREILGSFSLHTNQWKLLLFNEKEFKSFHILDGIFIIYSFRPDWDLPFTVIHDPSDDIGKLWAERKKKKKFTLHSETPKCLPRKKSLACQKSNFWETNQELFAHSSLLFRENSPSFYKSSILLFLQILQMHTGAGSGEGWGGWRMQQSNVTSHPRFMTWR